MRESLRSGFFIAMTTVGGLLAGTASAGGCTSIDPIRAPDLASRISAVACREHVLWYEPFIEADGRLASVTVAEMETTRLSDGATPTWKRVVDYWRGSGLLGHMGAHTGASTCEYVTNDSYASPNCRAFIADKPWSAAFVSYVMVQSGVPGFGPSASHIDYVRDAYLHPERSPFLFADPDTGAPATGDLLCYVRGATSAVQGHAGLRGWIEANHHSSLAMHCEVIVDVDDTRAHLIGGNVLQGVTLRLLPLNRTGRFWGLPHGRNIGCSPRTPKACSFNNQNWAALLKLKPSLPMHAPPSTPSWQTPPTAPRCCVNCVLGSGVPRCPSPETQETPAEPDRL